MIINDIEYAIRFWIDDEADETILDEVFGTLEEMNEFIEKIWHDPQYEDLIAKFSPVEVINGEPEEAVRYIYEIDPLMPLEASEIEDYLYDIEADFRASAEMAERFGEDTKFTPKEDAADYESKRKHRDEFTYICPYCFRELDDCRCATYPYHLVQIDKLIVPIVRTLNQKGYITTACCSGHIDELHCCCIYLAFKDEHNFGSNIPAGAAYAKTGHTLSYNGLDKMTREERITFQAECIEKLTAWADALPKL